MDCDCSDSNFVPYTAQRRALAPSHALFEAGNWRRDFLARENAPKVLCSSVDTLFARLREKDDNTLASQQV